MAASGSKEDAKQSQTDRDLYEELPDRVCDCEDPTLRPKVHDYDHMVMAMLIKRRAPLTRLLSAIFCLRNDFFFRVGGGRLCTRPYVSKRRKCGQSSIGRAGLQVGKA